MVSQHERQALKGVRNYGKALMDPRLGPNAECLLAFLRGVDMPMGKLAEQNCDPRQRGALLRARSDLSALIGATWGELSDDERRTRLEAAGG